MDTILYYVNNLILKIYLEKIYAFTRKNGLFRYRSIKYGKAQPSSEAKRPPIKTAQEESKVCTVPIILLKHKVHLLNIYNFPELFSQPVRIKMYFRSLEPHLQLQQMVILLQTPRKMLRKGVLQECLPMQLLKRLMLVKSKKLRPRLMGPPLQAKLTRKIRR